MPNHETHRENLDQLEANFHYDTSYLRTILNKHPEAYGAFADFMPLSRYRRDLPLEAFCVAKLTAMKVADCSACLALNIKMAIAAGLSETLVRAVVEDGELENDLERVRTFAERVASHQPVGEAESEALREYYGTTAWIELAMAIASVGVYPLIKRAMGLATSCANMALVYS